MAANFCQMLQKERQTVSVPYLSFRLISLAAFTEVFHYHSG
jgi:hypothetical protein